MSNKRFVYETRPCALSHNIVTSGNARFTVLTDRLIRLEYSQNRSFVDSPSQTVFYRDFPKVEFNTSSTKGELKIETKSLVIKYKENEEFSADTLSISLKCEPASVWHYGESVDNLGGTYKTLDKANGAVKLEDGVCSRYGYTVLDDSNTMLLNDEGWVEVRKNSDVDLYFFGYGYNYLDAVKDFYRLTGAPPMLPAYALGNWWSRYYKYTEQSYLELMDRYKTENIPFSVSVVDMDWHIVDVSEEERETPKDFERHNIYGWTGYTWNEKYFPDYKRFLKEIKKRNLKTSLNLHPHSGVRPHEAQYNKMAEIMGQNPNEEKRVPFDILNPKFMQAYFDVLHHPYEEDGVDFWWMDWQQGNTYWWIHDENKDGKLKDEREILDPLWMLNHLHIADIKRNGKRPMFFSRFSGAGSQRYPIGFSGDTVMTWKSLDFQPYFTATASNIGYTWWSHDIGGHMFGYRDSELVLRWLQLGVFSPINRLHSCGNEATRKEPWSFDNHTEGIMGDWLRLRHRLFPYIYTMNYRNHKELEPLIQPMYYHYPKCDMAYDMKNQYFFGSELMVAPITSPSSKITGLGGVDVFLPKGDWFDFFGGSHYHSEENTAIKVFRDKGSYPVFAKAGAIVPLMELKPQDNTLVSSDSIEVVVFPGASNQFDLYEDIGEYSDFEKGQFSTTKMALDFGEKTVVFTINAAMGDTSMLPSERKWKLCFRGFSDSCSCTVYVNGIKQSVELCYNPKTLTLELIVNADITEEIRVEINGNDLITDNGDIRERCLDIMLKSKLASGRLCILEQNINKANSYDEIYKMLFGVSSYEEQDLADAILEQFLLLN